MPACGMLLDIVASTIRELKKDEYRYMWFELDGEDMTTYCIYTPTEEEKEKILNEIIEKKKVADFNRTLDVKEKYITKLMYLLDKYESIERIEILVYQLHIFEVLESTTMITGRRIYNERN